MFEVGGFAVCPGHGVGLIEAIENMKIGSQAQRFYVVRLLDSQAKIKVPLDDDGNIREVIGREKIPELYNMLKAEADLPDNSQPWNQRNRNYLERINSGSIFELGRVLRELWYLKNEKGLSFGEKRLMETARRLIVKELAVSKGAEEAEIRRELGRILP
jgi:CarD family transcriptional regulator